MTSQKLHGRVAPARPVCLSVCTPPPRPPSVCLLTSKHHLRLILEEFWLHMKNPPGHVCVPQVQICAYAGVPVRVLSLALVITVFQRVQFQSAS